ncbi:MAG: aminotransferase class IV [Verrucomicrobia bacterium]|nr:aminotransferase class IV [Verrucomicrobiota bacterium]
MNPASIPQSFPLVYHCGQFQPAQETTVSIFDRGLLYGDGLFETLRVHNGHPLRWDQHFDRLRLGAEFLGIALPQSPAELRTAAARLAELNQTSTALLRLTLTRGVGPRGYSSAQATHPTLLMTLHPAPPVDPHAPPCWHLVTSTRIRLCPDEALTRFKTCNRLPYILARQEADAARVDDALILNTRGEVAETSAANIFRLSHGNLETPTLQSGALPGVTRATVLSLARELGLPTRERAMVPDELLAADAVFLTITSLGLVEAISLDRRPLARSPLVASLYTTYWRRSQA